MATGKLVSGSAVINDGGTLFGAGPTMNGPMTETVGYGRPNGPAFGSMVNSGVGLGIQKILSAGNFAKVVAGEYIIYGASNKIAGVTSNLMKYTGTSIGQRNNLNYRTTRKTYIPLWYDYLTGTNSGVISDDDFGTDDEATNVGRSWNGEFSLHLGKGTPSSGDYPTKQAAGTIH